MDKFLEKFNNFDIFSMLIPSLGISSLFCVSLFFKYYSMWQNMGNEKYTIFLLFSYFLGVFYHELGTVTDEIFLYKISYGGHPKEVSFLENGQNKLLEGKLFYEDIQCIKDHFIQELNVNVPSPMTQSEEKKINSTIFSYCLDLSEYKNLTTKADKMMVISKMSRSLLWGCITTIFLDIYS